MATDAHMFIWRLPFDYDDTQDEDGNDCVVDSKEEEDTLARTEFGAEEDDEEVEDTGWARRKRQTGQAGRTAKTTDEEDDTEDMHGDGCVEDSARS